MLINEHLTTMIHTVRVTCGRGGRVSCCNLNILHACLLFSGTLSTDWVRLRATL